MKKLLLALLSILSLSTVYAQTPASKTPATTPPVSTVTITVRGTVIDSANGKPVGYVTVALQNPQTQVPVKSTLTKDDGTFKLTAPEANYKLALAFVGYSTKFIALKSGQTEINVGSVKLAASTKQLKEVSVTSVRPIVKQEIDRIGYDVQADPESKTQNVLDLLRKVPLVTVDANDNIQLKGGSNYKILINGKPSSLVAHNPSDVFKSMPASNIEKIEVITTPPAKYDAEGLAGIINIITKKKIDQGYNGSINTRYNTLYGPGGGGSLTVKEGKFGLSSYFGYSKNKNRTSESTSDFQTYDTATPRNMLTDLQQNSTNNNNGHFIYSSVELSYEIDTLNLITGEFGLDKGNFYSNSTQFTQQLDGSHNLTQQYVTNNNGSSNFEGIDIGVNYQLGFKGNKDRLLTASYKYTHSPNGSDNDIDFYDRISYTRPDFRQQNTQGTNEQTIQLDYVHPLKKVNIEGGAKAILRSNFSNFETANQDSTGNFVRDPLNSNDFNYQQDVYSLYNTYQINRKDWGIKAGARLEETTVNANFISAGGKLDNSYNNLIPSVSVQRKLKGNGSLTLGFTNRIQRPDIYELNPFVNDADPKFVSTGNPNLKPVINHSFDLNFSKFGKGNMNFGLNYSFANNTIQSLTNLRDSVSYTTYQNIGSDKHLALNINLGWPIGKKINVNVNGSVSQVWLRGYSGSQLYVNSGFQGYTFAYAGYRITPTTRIGVNGGFYSSNILLQGRSSSSVFTSASFSKDVLNKKGSFYFSANNPFTHYRTYSSVTNDPQFHQTSASLNPIRAFGFGFNYRFGKLKADIKKNQRGISNDDTKGKSSGSSGQ